MHSRFGNLKGWGWELPHTFTVGRENGWGWGETEAEKTRLGLCTAPERNSIFYLLVLPEERLIILAKLENDFVLSAGRQKN